MELEDDLGYGLGEIIGWIWRANVECPAVGFGGVILNVVLTKIECDGAVGDWEAGCGVVEAVTTACSLGGGSVVRHGESKDFSSIDRLRAKNGANSPPLPHIMSIFCPKSTYLAVHSLYADALSPRPVHASA